MDQKFSENHLTCVHHCLELLWHYMTPMSLCDTCVCISFVPSLYYNVLICIGCFCILIDIIVSSVSVEGLWWRSSGVQSSAREFHSLNFKLVSNAEWTNQGNATMKEVFPCNPGLEPQRFTAADSIVEASVMPKQRNPEPLQYAFQKDYGSESVRRWLQCWMS